MDDQSLSLSARCLRAAPRISPSEAPESEDPYWAMASFSSATSSALIDTATLRVLRSNWGDAAVELLPDREALGALLGAVARKLGTLDEGV